MRMDVAQLGAWMREYATAEAFRAETRQTYEVASDGSDYRRYLDGAPTWTPERKDPWLATLRGERAAGFRRHRVRIVTRPVTPYTRYEAEWGYAPNVAAGEDVRVLDLGERELPPELGPLAEHDWWLVTDRAGRHRVAVMHYGPDGAFEGADARPALHVPAFVEARDLLWSAAEPFTAWWTAHPELHRDGRAAA